ncbi:hypothetical protein NW767_012240 [Fusarium falciforme]|nr:hypothetical protein NW767_012240 [Fusarium falciforme]
MFLVTQALQFMDKTSLNYANLFGYQEALGLKGNQFNYLSASQSPRTRPFVPFVDSILLIRMLQWSMPVTSSDSTLVDS